uniref:ORF3 n=1 Tax=Macoma balthica TaxID=1903275 RepID=A0A6B7FW08_MACBL|nr:ORF3 [Macoma balthica]
MWLTVLEAVNSRPVFGGSTLPLRGACIIIVREEVFKISSFAEDPHFISVCILSLMVIVLSVICFFMFFTSEIVKLVFMSKFVKGFLSTLFSAFLRFYFMQGYFFGTPEASEPRVLPSGHKDPNKTPKKSPKKSPKGPRGGNEGGGSSSSARRKLKF